MNTKQTEEYKMNGESTAFELALGRDGRNRLAVLLNKALHEKVNHAELKELRKLNKIASTFVKKCYADSVRFERQRYWCGPHTETNIGNNQTPYFADCLTGYNPHAKLPPIPIDKMDFYSNCIAKVSRIYSKKRQSCTKFLDYNAYKSRSCIRYKQSKRARSAWIYCKSDDYSFRSS